MTLTWEDTRTLLCLNRIATGRAAREALIFFQQGLKPAEVCERLMSEGWVQEEKLFPAEAEFHPEREMEKARLSGIQILTWFDNDYPERLKAIDNAPLLLYVLGQWTGRDEAAVAVVGSREPSLYGSTQAARLAQELASCGVSVVSGLARGIDEAAHQGCLRVPHGRTLAVLGCGPDKIYPRENQKLYAAIAERGAVISEFPLGTEPLARNFPRRNRIISGLSLGVLVVEAHLRSGSLITARLAAEQGRQVFAVPGPVDQWTSRGTHQLLREGAVLVEKAQDILEDLAPWLKSLTDQSAAETPAQEEREGFVLPRPFSLDIKQEQPGCWDEALIDILKQGPQTADEIAGRGAFAAHRILSALSSLEILGQIRKNPNGQFQLVREVRG